METCEVCGRPEAFGRDAKKVPFGSCWARHPFGDTSDALTCYRMGIDLRDKRIEGLRPRLVSALGYMDLEEARELADEVRGLSGVTGAWPCCLQGSDPELWVVDFMAEGSFFRYRNWVEAGPGV